MSKGKLAAALLGSALVVTALAATAPASKHEKRVTAPPSGVVGTVGLVEGPCPFAGCGLEATVIARQEGRVVAWTQSNHRGRFRLRLRRGKYQLLAWPLIRGIYCKPVAVRVPAGKVRTRLGCKWIRDRNTDDGPAEPRPGEDLDPEPTGPETIPSDPGADPGDAIGDRNRGAAFAR